MNEGLKPEMANDLIAYLQQKGMNARISMREGLEGMDEWEVLEAMTKEKHPVRYHWSTALFQSLSLLDAFKLIDKHLSSRMKSTSLYDMPDKNVTHKNYDGTRRAVTLQFEYEGRIYKGAAYEITAEEANKHE